MWIVRNFEIVRTFNAIEMMISDYFFFIHVWKKGINYILTLIKVETAWILLVLRRMDEANDATLKPIAQEV